MKSSNSGRKASTTSGPLSVVWKVSVTLTLFFSRFQVISGSAILEISPCVPKWFEGMPLNLTCVYKSGNIDKRVYFITNGAPVVQCNKTFGSCFSFQPGYEVIGSSSGSMTVMIQSFNGSDDATQWKCMDASPPNPPASCIINSTISAKYEIKQNQLESLTKVSLPFSVSVTGNCIYLLPTCTWKYKISSGTKNNVPDTLAKITSNNDTCNSTDEESKCTLSFDQIPSEFAGHKINIILEIDHPSLKPAEQLRIVSPELTIPDNRSTSVPTVLPQSTSSCNLVCIILITVVSVTGVCIIIVCCLISLRNKNTKKNNKNENVQLGSEMSIEKTHTKAASSTDNKAEENCNIQENIDTKSDTEDVESSLSFKERIPNKAASTNTSGYHGNPGADEISEDYSDNQTNVQPANQPVSNDVCEEHTEYEVCQQTVSDSLNKTDDMSDSTTVNQHPVRQNHNDVDHQIKECSGIHVTIINV